jgi:hypothetical protein
MCLATMDESGDTGMKLGNGSSSNFTIAMVLFQEVAPAEACRDRIRELRGKLGMKQSGKAAEFHFCRMGEEHREEFLRAVAEFPFLFYSCTLKKAELSRTGLGGKASMYRDAGVRTLDQALSNMLDAKLIFDATSSRQFDWDFLRFLKQHAGYYDEVPIIRETQRLDSYKDDLVQLIDMVCGAVMCDDRRYHRLIRHREGGRILLPGEEKRNGPGNSEGAFGAGEYAPGQGKEGHPEGDSCHAPGLAG